MTAEYGRHIALVGPTGSGKSQLAMRLAGEDPRFEIVSVDAMCVYREMDIGTAKPTTADRAAVRHHLVDVVDPADDYTLARFQGDCAAAVRDIEARDKRALLAGGTGLYVRAAIDGLDVPPQFPEIRAELDAIDDTSALYRRLAAADPIAATKMEPTNRRRIIRALEVTEGAGRRFSSFGPGLDAYPPTRFRIVGLWPPRESMPERLARRFALMMDAGLVDEVRALSARPGGVSRTARQALGYRQLFEHVEGGRPLAECVDIAVKATVQFARRQRVWFRRDPRIAWVNADIGGTAVAGGQHW